MTESNLNQPISKVQNKKDKNMNPPQELDPSRYVVLHSVLEMTDPAHNIKASAAPIAQKDVQGYLIALTFDIVDYSSYELYSYVEETLKTEVEDLSIFRSPITNKPTGLVVVQLVEDVNTSRLKKLTEQTFKGRPVQVRLFSNELKFAQFLNNNVEEKLRQVYLPLKQATPIVFVQNFVGNDDDLTNLFGKCGKINLIRMSHIKKCIFYTIYYDKEVATRLACRTLNGFVVGKCEMIVTALYPRASERCFGVSNCDAPDELRVQIQIFGNIEKMKQSKDGTFYFLMETLNSSRYACTLINSRKIGTHRVFTFFVEYEQFDKRIK